MLRQSRFGTTAYSIPALDRFPPPDFLTEMQSNLWIAALSDFPLEFFRARHIPTMIQYVRATERAMFYNDQYEADPEDVEALNMFERMSRLAARLERQLCLNTGHLVSMVVRARSEMKLANQTKNAKEAGEGFTAKRLGLVYVGH
jgi:hypothetical protein